jgi:predicted enzyme related to lactoylglutathione lyase
MPVEEVLGDPAHYLNLAPPANAPNGPGIALQRVPEPKRGKNRVHLDIEVDDVDAATDRVEALGGRRASAVDVSEHGYNWRVMADPEGNEFCLIFTQT